MRYLVEIGPRPPGSDAIHRAQSYIIGQLKSYGCQVEEHDFHGSTSIGDIAMKNIIAKIPGTKTDIVLYTAHYDTLRMANFVGADKWAPPSALGCTDASLCLSVNRCGEVVCVAARGSTYRDSISPVSAIDQDLSGRLPSKSYDTQLGQFPKASRTAQTATVTLTRMATNKVGSFFFHGKRGEMGALRFLP
jgi:hypothetical protein